MCVCGTSGGLVSSSIVKEEEMKRSPELAESCYTSRVVKLTPDSLSVTEFFPSLPPCCCCLPILLPNIAENVSSRRTRPETERWRERRGGRENFDTEEEEENETER